MKDRKAIKRAKRLLQKTSWDVYECKNSIKNKSQSLDRIKEVLKCQE